MRAETGGVVDWLLHTQLGLGLLALAGASPPLLAGAVDATAVDVHPLHQVPVYPCPPLVHAI
jgi:hypothetical protein